MKKRIFAFIMCVVLCMTLCIDMLPFDETVKKQIC